ncbi:GntR family transcriptional regulator [Acidisphaera sp. L21]|uniref:GntR family transcriptional regulator n=1 Tax=Acidisphaera sp. L21 TaxID=1641851 RepID=UPI00131A7315|nr:GntR family transcriptional regulator [Acidisphaera sp. L21]
MQQESRPWAPAKARVYDYVRRAILDGELAGGTFLEEERVCLAVGVSRTPVREAFQQLESERLIDLMPRRGALVRAVTVQELMEVYETRLMIESHAVRKLCSDRQGPPPSMVQTLSRMQQSEDDQTLEHVQLNTAFHRALVAAAGNSVMLELFEFMSTRQERVAMTSISIEPTRRDVILMEHEHLVQALAEHDAASAVATLTDHLRPIREILLHLPGASP